MPQVRISHTATHPAVVWKIAEALQANGIDARLDEPEPLWGLDLVEAFEDMHTRSDAVLFVVTGYTGQSPWVRRELRAMLDTSVRSGALILPVFIGDTEELRRNLPYELERRQAVTLDPEDPNAYVQLAALVVEQLRRRGKLLDIGEELRDFNGLLELVVGAFRTANRILQPTRDHLQLLSPGPVWISPAAVLTPSELNQFAANLPHGGLGHIVHAGEIREDTAFALDRMRIGGKSVVIIPVRALRAAHADQRVGSYLAELERDYGNSDNLFDTKNAIIYERFLFGRDKLLNTIGSALHRHEHILLTGLRKVGKTSVLNILRQHLVDRPVCQVDLQRYDRHHEDWSTNLFRSMLAAFDTWGRTENAPWPFDTPSPTTASDLEAELELRQEHLKSSGQEETTLVVIMDELERVFPAPGEQHATRQWIRASGALRALAQGNRRHVAVVGADLRPSVNRDNDLGPEGTNPFFQFFQEMPVPVLEREAVDDLINSLSRSMAIDVVSDEFLDTLFDLTGGHPSLVRKLAGESYRQRQDSYELHAHDLEAALDQLESNDDVGSFLRNNLWDLMTKVEQEVVLGEVFGRPLPAYIGVGERKQAEAALRGQGLLSIGLFRDLVRDEKG